MTRDLCMLAGIELTGFAAPEKMPHMAKHAMTIHDHSGGGRVIDRHGSRKPDVSFGGKFIGSSAWQKALMLSAMCEAGQEVSLIYGGQFLNVIISQFDAKIVKYPHHVDYNVTCTPTTSGSLGAVGISTQTMLGNDFSLAASF